MNEHKYFYLEFNLALTSAALSRFKSSLINLASSHSTSTAGTDSLWFASEYPYVLLGSLSRVNFFSATSLVKAGSTIFLESPRSNSTSPALNNCFPSAYCKIFAKFSLDACTRNKGAVITEENVPNCSPTAASKRFSSPLNCLNSDSLTSFVTSTSNTGNRNAMLYETFLTTKLTC